MSDLNVNATECIVKKTGFLETTVTNICNGAVAHVPHGSVDMLAGTVFILFFSGVACFIAFALYDIFFRKY